jgi:hypothetical protein
MISPALPQTSESSGGCGTYCRTPEILRQKGIEGNLGPSPCRLPEVAWCYQRGRRNRCWDAISRLPTTALGTVCWSTSKCRLRDWNTHYFPLPTTISSILAHHEKKSETETTCLKLSFEVGSYGVHIVVQRTSSPKDSGSSSPVIIEDSSVKLS